MASSYSTDLKLELMVTGENAGTWGDNTNNNLNLIQQAIAGYEAVALTDGGTVALAMTDKTISNARNMVIKFTGTLTSASTVTIPDSIEKFYIFDCSAVVAPTNLTIKTASGTGFTIDAAKIYAAYSDGTNLNEVSLDTLGGTIGGGQIANDAIKTANISDNQITTAKISDNQITTAKISDNQITSAKISDLQVTTAKIADDSVTPDKLSDTAVTAGSYDLASITVDAQGRITAASSGSAGGAASLTFYQEGPYSGTFTASPGTTKLGVLAMGGGGAGFASPNSYPGSSGGNAGFGYFSVPISAPYSVPYTIGGGGATSGAAGNPTTLNSTDAVATSGGGGNRNPNFPRGQHGNAPGAYYNYSPLRHTPQGAITNGGWQMSDRQFIYGPAGSSAPGAAEWLGTMGDNATQIAVKRGQYFYSPTPTSNAVVPKGGGGKGGGSGSFTPGGEGFLAIYETSN